MRYVNELQIWWAMPNPQLSLSPFFGFMNSILWTSSFDLETIKLRVRTEKGKKRMINSLHSSDNEDNCWDFFTWDREWKKMREACAKANVARRELNWKRTKRGIWWFESNWNVKQKSAFSLLHDEIQIPVNGSLCFIIPSPFSSLMTHNYTCTGWALQLTREE